MARGNQRDKAREKNLKAQAGVKNKTTLSGSEQAKAKENAADIMRRKQLEAEERKKAAAEEAAKKK